MCMCMCMCLYLCFGARLCVCLVVFVFVLVHSFVFVSWLLTTSCFASVHLQLTTQTGAVTCQYIETCVYLDFSYFYLNFFIFGFFIFLFGFSIFLFNFFHISIWCISYSYLPVWVHLDISILIFFSYFYWQPAQFLYWCSLRKCWRWQSPCRLKSES
jgi:hypothetical protein